MRKIIVLTIDDPIPDDARPIGVAVEKVSTSLGYTEELRFYYDVPVKKEKR